AASSTARRATTGAWAGWCCVATGWWAASARCGGVARLPPLVLDDPEVGAAPGCGRRLVAAVVGRGLVVAGGGIDMVFGFGRNVVVGQGHALPVLARVDRQHRRYRHDHRVA